MTFTAKTVKLSPSQFVEDATTEGFAVEDHLTKSGRWGDRFPPLKVHHYLCGNPKMGATVVANFNRSSGFWNALIKEQIKDPNKNGALTTILSQMKDFGLVAKGQGYPIDFTTMLEYAWANKEIMVKKPTLAPYFKLSTLKELIEKADNDNIFGWDCIGFVHQYLYAAGVVDKYLGYTALGYLTAFKPISSLDDIEPLCICSWSNGSHIVIIDHIVLREKDFVIVDLCQSSGAVKTTHMATIVRSGNYGIDKDGNKTPLIAFTANLGNPAQFYIKGDVPMHPNVVIGRLPGLRLARGDASP